MLYDGQEDIAKIEFEYYKEDINPPRYNYEMDPKITHKGFDRDSTLDANPISSFWQSDSLSLDLDSLEPPNLPSFS